ncbi:hypothetical protein BDA96_01G021600 [Sorghum bicolor]|uniref:J domain-containing protein n=1 Tax=Sorghum bicolor TaxID=4558 RepID=A0A921UX68_SORBI|nr:hypothetical protein BDA96_01G021600 [Sorghum bicolor]
MAENAKRLCPSLPDVDNAIAAYKVHANATADGGAGGWRAILSIGPGADAATQDAVKKQFRRLSLLVHPDKTHCAAAESAFRLLREAHDEALSPPRPAPSRSRPADRDTSTPPPPAAAAAQPGRPPRPKVTVLMMMQPPVQEPREPILIYCPSCKNEFRGMVGRRERREGMRCARCPAWLNTPWQTKPPTEKKPPAAPGRQVFQCPAKCPGCGERYTSMVCVGRWCLQCKACSKAAMVDVHGPDEQAAASIATCA